MRILFLGNNNLGLNVMRWLLEHGEHIVGVALHPPQNAKLRDEIVALANQAGSVVLDGSKLRDEATLACVRSLEPDVGVSALFGYILRNELLELLPKGCVNLHPALLPYNRGAYPNVWSIVEHTPAGVTLHQIDSGIDTGDIIAQREVPVSPVDTGASLYGRLETEAMELFCEWWPMVRSDKAPRTPQPAGRGTSHRVRDVEAIDEIDPQRQYKAQELIDLLRARTFPPFPGAYFRHDGRKIYLRLQLLQEDEL